MTRNADLAALATVDVSVWLSRDRLRTGDPAELMDTTSDVRVTFKSKIFHHTLWKRHNCDAQIPETCDELDTAAGTRQKCRAGELGGNGL
jgi:transaldolase